jgi:hypothetical protein
MSQCTPDWFHQHLLDCNCEFQNLTIDFLHAVYKNPKNGRKYTILKECDEMLPENVLCCCYYLQIPSPGGSDKPMTKEEFHTEFHKVWE